MITLDGAKEFMDALQALHAQSPGAAARALNKIGAEMHQVCADRAPGGRAGSLGKTIAASRATIANPETRIGSPHPGARIQQWGGVIKPGSSNPTALQSRVFPGRQVKFLTIPMPGFEGKRARMFPKLVYFTTPEGRFLGLPSATNDRWNRKLHELQAKVGAKRINQDKLEEKIKLHRDGRVLPRAVFRLVKQVTIKPHPYLYWDRGDIQNAKDAIQREVEALAAKRAAKAE